MKQWLLTGVCLLFLLMSVGVYIFVWRLPQRQQVLYQVELLPLSALPVPKSKLSLLSEPELSASSAAALDLTTMTVLYQKQAELPLPPASTVKMMTALVASEQHNLDERLSVLQLAAANGSNLPLRLGQTFATRDLLAALLIASSNDVAEFLAESSPLGRVAFIGAMNQRASDLGLRQTVFLNPSGLDEAGQVSSAYDLLLIARALLRQPVLREIVAQPQWLMLEQNTQLPYQLYNTNQLLYSLQGVRGVKTGTTAQAGQVLVTLLERDGRQILLSLMGSQDRYADTSRLIAWIFNNYEWRDVDVAVYTSGQSLEF